MSIALVLGSLGCAGTATQRSSSPNQLETTVQELEAAAQEERRKVRDLTYEIARLENQMRTRGAAATTPDMPELPVEVLQPEDSPTDAAGSADRDEYDVVGFDEDGVEIVYVGDAAEDRSVQPDTSYLRSAPRPRTARAARTPRTKRRASPTWDAMSDRIPVTDDAGPTVQRQLAAARSRAQGQTTAEAPKRVLSTTAGTMSESRSPTVAKPASQRAKKPAAKRAKTSAGQRSSRTASADPKVEYNRYYQALRAGNHTFAITGFENFIERNPQHGYADNARYWLAEAYYDQRQYQVALREFRKVQRDYPTGNKVPDALLKVAFCQLALGEQESARATLRALMENHPTSKPAALAAQRLQALGGE